MSDGFVFASIFDDFVFAFVFFSIECPKFLSPSLKGFYRVLKSVTNEEGLFKHVCDIFLHRLVKVFNC